MVRSSLIYIVPSLLLMINNSDSEILNPTIADWSTTRAPSLEPLSRDGQMELVETKIAPTPVKATNSAVVLNGAVNQEPGAFILL